MGPGQRAEPPARIAVVGWGSLIWDPRELPLRSPWQPDGPELPIEFARVSADGRLTLVLRQGADDVRTLWALMSDVDLDIARRHLAQRERTSPDRIGWLGREHRGGGETIVGSATRTRQRVLDQLTSWLARRQLDMVIWTGLPSNFEEETGQPLSVAAAVNYARALPAAVQQVAETYVRQAPQQVKTGVRQGLEDALGWSPSSASIVGAPGRPPA